MSSEDEPAKPESQVDQAALNKAQTFFQYGNDAALKSNFDYAIAMYKQACKIVTDNLVYRQALRGIERRKFNNDPNKVGMLVGAKNQPILMRAKSARSKGNLKHSIDVCEDAFVNNPWDVGAARVAAEAAEKMGLLLLAQWFVESVQAVTKDVDFLKFAAHIHEENESWQKAIDCWEQVKKFSPNDQDASRQINALSAAGTIKRAGLDDALDKHAQPPARAGRVARRQARAAQARTAHARATPDQGDHGRPQGRPRLCRARRDLPQPQRSRKGREGPGQGPEGQSRRPGADVDLRRHADQPPEASQGKPEPARAPVSRRHRRQGQARPVDRDAQQVRDRGLPPARSSSIPKIRSSTSSWG